MVAFIHSGGDDGGRHPDCLNDGGVQRLGQVQRGKPMERDGAVSRMK